MRKIFVLGIAVVLLVVGIWYINILEYKGHAVKEKVYRNVYINEIKGNKVKCKINNKKRVFNTVSKSNKTYNNKRGILYLKNNKVVRIELIKNRKSKLKQLDKFDNYKKDKIRVIIKTKNYNGIKHKNLKVSSLSNMVITYGDNKNQICGKEINIKANCKYLKSNNKICINTVDKSNGIRLDSIKRGVKGVEYYGTIEVIKEGKNLIVVNEVDVEQYLCSVVPSEMPESFGYEALKVQAICARTYAYTHMNNKVYKKYNAHVDDSISYQVYNNRNYSDVTKKAVDDTKGIVLTTKKDLAKIFYYSTSCGYSCNTKDVFGGYNVEYLVSKKQSLDSAGKINKEKDFRKFILSTGEDCFEKNCEWFRWKIKWDVDKLSKTINSNLQRICGYKKNNYICVYRKNKYVSMSLKNIGTIKSIIISKRGSGGIVKEIIIKGTSRQIKVSSQNMIRKLLSPKNVSIKKSNKDYVKGMETLPSACFMVEKNKKDFIIIGGGFGHGVGMSQWGTFELTKLGKKYDEIIGYYFKNVQMTKIDN